MSTATHRSPRTVKVNLRTDETAEAKTLFARIATTTTAVIVAVIAGLVFLDSIRHKFYVFDHDKILSLAQNAVMHNPGNTSAIFDEIYNKLKADPKTGPHINSRHWTLESEWMFNNAGGAMGSMYLLHASVTEYLLFFGSPVGTEGHTGRHTADDYFNILTGEQYAYAAGALVSEHYPPGTVHHLRRGTVKQYMMPEGGCWALELAQGWIVPMVPFGLADVISSTLDFPTFGLTVWITAREMLGNLIRLKL